jgi:23S rRNA (adenine2503-C2)-methyltransferase
MPLGTAHTDDAPAVPPPLTPLGHTAAAFAHAARARGFGTARATALYAGFYRRGEAAALRAADPQGTALDPWIAPIVREQAEDAGDDGVTIKFVQRLDRQLGTAPSARAADRVPLGVLQHDDRVRHLDIESVIIPMLGSTGRRTHTLCVSSQVGCAMGCRFCETAQMGLIRSLTPAEIVGQWWAATHLKGARIDNIVFMGMGEPLDNLDAVLGAIECLTDHTGPAVPMSQITVSTVGRVDGLRRLTEVVARPGWKRLGIALSVNAPNDRVRSDLMPVNRRWDMRELRDAMLELLAVRPTRKIMFEYVLIPGVNDSPDDAAELAAWLAPFTRREDRNHAGLLNVIAYNPRRDSPWPAPSAADVDRFIAELASRGVFAKPRRTRGRSQMAACGQLGTEEIRGRRLVGTHAPERADGA